ncbi:NMDA receptor-regulated protein 1-domain-containing protein [Emericellopsis atlantica]|uniref:NMDA receptor-regulated protein 1-domain-containing protein n=1 Tax=Emericellopsis atlantica TaxID=2614577 RepID=A0A9P8CNU5_9HYPO|nr:NMDA receptor-regulated protein 1-domain-containing protein [Emericellopsis atlantica]KAG9253497.1 NMDA receptor-regulated protein 1-domain-containing protein [Emericellopsis atlantica]
MPQPLSAKDQTNFRNVVRAYEDKQYKRGLKTADSILKKNPKHGDTMAMKALILNGQLKTDEAFALAKEALSADFKSHICWHVYGLLYRAVTNFEEAIKAYKMALRFEPESAQIQRDLAILQIQMRDYQGYIQSRQAMLQARPGFRQSWTALAIAHHLAGDLAEAENVLSTYEGTLKSKPSRYDLEHSEAVMYKNSLIAEQGDYQRALEHLEEAAKQNLDRLAVMECRAEYLAKLGRREEAASAYRALIERNPDLQIYYEKLVEVLGISEDNTSERKAVYDEYASKFPRCDTAKRVPLDFLQGSEFRAAAEAYLTLMLNKGVPSTFANLKHLYADEFKKNTLRELAEEYVKSEGIDKESKDKGEAAGLFYLAQHYNYYMSRDLDKSLDYVEKTIEKDPKSVDYHMTKARIFKHQGDLSKASEMMDHARKLDLKDRYINSKAAKYQLRNNENERALKTVGLFTRQDTVGGPMADLLDMQCVWFLTEDGEAYARQGNVAMALKRFQAVATIFDTWQEDQFDFHSFSLRKGQIRAYIDMMRWEDHIRDHPFYSRAALAAIQVYLKLADKPSSNGVNGNGEDEDEALAKKKAAKKAKKEQQRMEREAAEKQAKQDPNKGTKTDDEPKKKDEDPMGLKLAATEDPLGEAIKLLEPLLEVCPKSIEAQHAGFEVYIRRQKHLLALRCLKAAANIDAESPRVHEQTIALRHALNGATDVPDKVAQVLKEEFNLIPASANLQETNDHFLAQHKDSPEHVLAAIRAKKILGEDRKSTDKQVIEMLDLPKTRYNDAISALQTLQQWRSPEEDAFKKAAQAKFPGATRFS